MSHSGLSIIIVGGGLAGLAAAISLRQNGHRVEIFEQSRFANEIGAAIHMTPNATGILRQIGIDPRDSGAVLLDKTRLFTADNKPISTMITESHRWQNPWLQAHRAHLHSQLKEAASSPNGPGTPVVLHVSSRVLSVNPHNASVSFADGTSRSADVLVGADGVHSVTRKGVMPNWPAPFEGGHSAFRFIIERQVVLDDPETAPLASVNSTMDMWYSSSEKIVLYPTYDNKLLNFVCIHPTVKSETKTDDYSTAGSKSKFLEIFKDFHPPLVKLFGKVDPAELKIYPLLDMETLPTYINDRLALIGDAAHPFTPHLAQGGAQALEDAVSLGVFLEKGLAAAEVPERLLLYNEARYSRSSKIQDLSRMVGGDRLASDEEQANKLSVKDYVDYGFSHDELHFSKQILRKYKWEQRPLRYRQPTVFGPAPGPRQDHDGNPFTESLRNSVSTKRVIEFKTSATLLRNMFPNSNYSFSKPDTIVTASFVIETLSNMAWLGGGGYDLLGFYIHDVCVRDKNGKVRKGVYCPLMLENLADPILTGREELGIPKLFSDITIEESADHCAVKVSWRGTPYAEFSWKRLASNEKGPGTAKVQDSEGLLVHKYMPSSKIGESSCENDLLLADKSQATSIRSQRVAAPHDVTFKVEDIGVSRLPTLHHIASRLAELPIFEIVSGTVTEYKGVTDFSNIEVLN